MPGSFRLGKLAGIEISVHVSWFLIVVLLTWFSCEHLAAKAGR